MTNPYDPKNHDRGPLTSGLRIRDDKRSHVDRLNGPWPCGPAVLPAIELRESQQAKAAVKKPRKKKVIAAEVVAADAVATDVVDAEVVTADTVIEAE